MTKTPKELLKSLENEVEDEEVKYIIKRFENAIDYAIDSGNLRLSGNKAYISFFCPGKIYGSAYKEFDGWEDKGDLSLRHLERKYMRKGWTSARIKAKPITFYSRSYASVGYKGVALLVMNIQNKSNGG